MGALILQIAAAAALLWFAVMFASSGAAKLDADNRREYLALFEHYPLPRRLLGSGLVTALGAAELLAAAGFLAAPLWPSAGLALPALLLLFTAMLALQLARGRRTRCGCSGPSDSLEISPALVLRNLVYCALAGAAWMATTRIPALALLLVVPLAGAMILADGAVTALLRNSQRLEALRGQRG